MRGEAGSPPRGRAEGSLSRLRELIWLDDRLAAASRAGFGEGRAGFSEYRLARCVLARARGLAASAPDRQLALLAYRSAVRLLLHARSAQATGSVPAADGDYSGVLSRFSPQSLADQDHRLLGECLGPGGESAVASLSGPQASAVERQLRELAGELVQQLEQCHAPISRVRRARWLRVGSLAALSVVALFVALREPNLARGAKVSAPNNENAHVPSAQQLVDGNRANLGFHVSQAPHVVTIDLGRERKISRVVVYNRADCCGERAYPLGIELGDGTRFETVAERQRPFNVWRARIAPKRARFVRLQSGNAAPFHLAEVEVY